jgi:hypothetical protein
MPLFEAFISKNTGVKNLKVGQMFAKNYILQLGLNLRFKWIILSLEEEYLTLTKVLVLFQETQEHQ